MERVPFTIYADFESILKPITEERGKKTERVQYHVPCSYGWVLISRHPDVPNLVKYYEEGDESVELNSEEEDEEEKELKNGISKKIKREMSVKKMKKRRMGVKNGIEKKMRRLL